MKVLINTTELDQTKSTKKVWSFLEENDSFYEGAYIATTKWSPKKERWYHLLPLWIMNYGYIWNIRKYTPKGSTILELGCGGGIQYLADNYEIIGLDLSFTSLNKTPYKINLQASATESPLKENSVDAVVSSFFWEHIPKDMKFQILEECQRILKPNGKIVFFYDVETNNPLIRKLKVKDINLYNKLFLEKDGHVGYHSPQENLRIFQKAGFSKIKHLGLERTRLLRVSEIGKLYKGRVVSRSYYKLTQLISQTPFRFVYEIVLQSINYLTSSILPLNNSRIIVSVFERKK